MNTIHRKYVFDGVPIPLARACIYYTRWLEWGCRPTFKQEQYLLYVKGIVLAARILLPCRQWQSTFYELPTALIYIYIQYKLEHPNTLVVGMERSVWITKIVRITEIILNL